MIYRNVKEEVKVFGEEYGYRKVKERQLDKDGKAERVKWKERHERWGYFYFYLLNYDEGDTQKQHKINGNMYLSTRMYFFLSRVSCPENSEGAGSQGKIPPIWRDV